MARTKCRGQRSSDSYSFYVNSSTIGPEVHFPFGGTKATGNGHREGAMAPSLDIFSKLKAIYVDYSGGLQKARMDITKKEIGSAMRAIT
jgi:aldehyde dehydrogenase (NAD+)